MGCCSDTHCEVDAPPVADAAPAADGDARRCPACGQTGRKVKAITIASLARTSADTEGQTWRFCATPGCDVAWFSEESHQRITVSESRVRIGQKERAADRPLCYCFGYSEADVVSQVATTGTSTIPDDITERCRRGEDRCEQTNPQGACCLGNVRAAMKAAQARLSDATPDGVTGSVTAEADASAGCCAAEP